MAFHHADLEKNRHVSRKINMEEKEQKKMKNKNGVLGKRQIIIICCMLPEKVK